MKDTKLIRWDLKAQSGVLNIMSDKDIGAHLADFLDTVIEEEHKVRKESYGSDEL